MPPAQKPPFLVFPLGIISAVCLFCCSCFSSGTNDKKACFKEQCVSVEVVSDNDDLARGLKYRNSLGKDSGMLFIFPKPGRHDFWMKDTLISLDILWLDENREVIYIAGHVPPCRSVQCPTYGPAQMSRYVLEVNAGYAQKHNIRIGERFEFESVEKPFQTLMRPLTFQRSQFRFKD